MNGAGESTFLDPFAEDAQAHGFFAPLTVAYDAVCAAQELKNSVKARELSALVHVSETPNGG